MNFEKEIHHHGVLPVYSIGVLPVCILQYIGVLPVYIGLLTVYSIGVLPVYIYI